MATGTACYVVADGEGRPHVSPDPARRDYVRIILRGDRYRWVHRDTIRDRRQYRVLGLFFEYGRQFVRARVHRVTWEFVGEDADDGGWERHPMFDEVQLDNLRRELGQARGGWGVPGKPERVRDLERRVARAERRLAERVGEYPSLGLQTAD